MRGKERVKSGIKEEREKGYKIIFWNVAGMENKDKDFWEMFKDCDIIVCIET